MSGRSTVVILMVFLTLIIAACTTTTEPDPYVPPSPLEPDSAWKVVWNLEFAYKCKDLNDYLACFRDDFIFHLSPLSSQPPDTIWGFDLEEQFHQGMFSFVDDIDLTLSGSAEWLWSGDSTDQSLELQRTFDLKVYYTIPGSPYEGSMAAGQTSFICRPDSNGIWYIWQWFDGSEQSGTLQTWTEIKAIF